jgi:hypothetical protein
LERGDCWQQQQDVVRRIGAGDGYCKRTVPVKVEAVAERYRMGSHIAEVLVAAAGEVVDAAVAGGTFDHNCRKTVSLPADRQRVCHIGMRTLRRSR